MKRTAGPWFPPETTEGDAAVGIFYTQNCPGYITDAARQQIQTVSQFRAREAWQPYHEIQNKLAEAAKANRTTAATELRAWCIAAEPRIAEIQDRLGKALNR
jgi:hypothetical protein